MEELERIYEYDIILPKASMEMGISNIGDTFSLRRALNKLVTGEYRLTIRVSKLMGKFPFALGLAIAAVFMIMKLLKNRMQNHEGSV